MKSTKNVLVNDYKTKEHVRPKLVVMTGVPGSGKTTFTKIIQEDFKFYRISTDEIRQLIFRFNETEFDINLLYQIQLHIIESLMMKNFNIISDANSTTNSQRHKLKELANKYNYSLSNFYCNASIESLNDRIKLRNYSNDTNKLNPDDLCYYLKELEVPDDCITLVTDNGFENNYLKIKKELKFYER